MRGYHSLGLSDQDVLDIAGALREESQRTMPAYAGDDSSPYHKRIVVLQRRFREIVTVMR